MLAPSRQRRYKGMIVWPAHGDQPFLFLASHFFF